MSDFIKTGDPVDTYSLPGAPCVACTCQDTAMCDDYKYVYGSGGSVGIQNTNWIHPGSGTEVN